jgi:hypothetical protein
VEVAAGLEQVALAEDHAHHLLTVHAQELEDDVRRRDRQVAV